MALAVLATLATRFVGLDFLLPHRPFGDERVWIGHVALLRMPEDVARRNEGFGFYPQLVPRVAQLVAPDAPPATAASFDEHVERASRDAVILRAISVCISALTPLATFLVARRFVGPLAAALAAWLVALSALTAWFAPQARPHGAATALCTLGIWACMRVQRSGRPRDYALAGAVAFAAASVLQLGFLLVAPLAAAHVLRGGARSWTSWASLAGALALLAAAIPAFYPFVFVEAPAAATGRAALGGHHVMGQAFLDPNLVDGRGFVVLLQTLWSVEPGAFVAFACALPMLVAAAFAAMRARRGRRWAELCREHAAGCVAAAFVAPYVLLFGLYGLTFSRYLLHVMPFVAIAIAAGAVMLIGRSGSPHVRRAVIAVIACTLLVQAVLCVQLARLRAAPDTYEEAAAFLRERLVQPERALTFSILDLPVLRDDEGMRDYYMAPDTVWATPWQDYQHRLDASARRGADNARGSADAVGLDTLDARTPEDLEELRERGEAVIAARAARLLVVDAHEVERRKVLARLVPNVSSARVARLTPERADTGDTRPLLFRDQGDEWKRESSWAWRVIRARALGPVLEVHELRR